MAFLNWYEAISLQLFWLKISIKIFEIPTRIIIKGGENQNSQLPKISK